MLKLKHWYPPSSIIIHPKQVLSSPVQYVHLVGGTIYRDMCTWFSVWASRGHGIGPLASLAEQWHLKYIFSRVQSRVQSSPESRSSPGNSTSRCQRKSKPWVKLRLPTTKDSKHFSYSVTPPSPRVSLTLVCTFCCCTTIRPPPPITACV